LFMELKHRSLQIVRQVPAFWQLAVGFLNPLSESNNFGVIVLTLDAGNHQSFDPLILEPIEIEKKTFPVIVRQLTVEEHALPSMHPSKG
ncbi:hypothetical protein SJ263_23765, partial [Enterobacter hormaechei]|uniref:hypothetical protein n=1 Tax=Enterobacter hormaechei TaxID=158836 RepID=UPI0029DB312C